MTLGPLELIVIAFPEERIDLKVVGEFASVVDAGAVTIVDLLVVRKDAAGEVSVDEFDIGDLDGISLSEKLDLISAEDAEAVGEGLAPETCAAVIVFEQTWAKAFAHAVGAVGGQVAIRLPIPYDVAEAAAAALGVDA
jgi:Family of unknown function (DUF6325)